MSNPPLRLSALPGATRLMRQRLCAWPIFWTRARIPERCGYFLRMRSLPTTAVCERIPEEHVRRLSFANQHQFTPSCPLSRTEGSPTGTTGQSHHWFLGIGTGRAFGGRRKGLHCGRCCHFLTAGCDREHRDNHHRNCARAGSLICAYDARPQTAAEKGLAVHLRDLSQIQHREGGKMAEVATDL